MTNAKQKIEIPGEERPLFWDTEDEAVVARLRKDAQKAGVDWTVPKAIGPAEIGRIVDELYPDPDGRKCGPAKQYRIQKLIPYLPCAVEDDEPEGEPEAPEAPEVPLPEAPEVQAPEQKQAEGAPESPEAGHLPAEGKPSAWSRFQNWRRARAEDTPEADEDELPERGWPILIVAASAFVAVWSGWVGLGKMTGFGMMDLLPGFTHTVNGKVVPLLQINTAITLPLGIEAYAGYALRAFVNGRGSRRTRTFAGLSGFVALVLGGFGQLAYHLLATEGRTVAPEEVTIFVSCLPVACIGAVTTLHHMLSQDRKRARRARRARQKESSGNA